MATFQHNVPATDLLCKLLRANASSSTRSALNLLTGAQCEGRTPKEPSAAQIALARIAAQKPV